MRTVEWIWGNSSAPRNSFIPHYSSYIVFAATCCVKLTSKSWWQVPCLHRSRGQELAQGHLQVVERFADHQEDYDIWDEEGTPAIAESCEGKPPDVPQPHWHGDAGHQELKSIWPLLAWGTFFLLFSVFNSCLLGKNRHTGVLNANVHIFKNIKNHFFK